MRLTPDASNPGTSKPASDSGNSPEVIRLLELAAGGDNPSQERLFHESTGRLARTIALRMDRRLSSRMDVDDVLQEVHLQASQHLGDFLRNPAVPFYLWLRGVAINVLLELHRRHLGTQMRDARRELSLSQKDRLEASSQVLALHFADSATSPSNAAMRGELKSRLEAVVDRLPPADKEILALRHFEQLTPSETALELQISEKAAGMRYLRALKRLRELLTDVPGGLSQWRW